MQGHQTKKEWKRKKSGPAAAQDCRTLNHMKPGEQARVAGLGCSGMLRRRLLDLGFVEGALISCVGKSPQGDPKAYEVRGAVLAIRAKDGKLIRLKGESDGTDC